MNDRTKRILYLDALRVWATVSVICLHASAQNWGVSSKDIYMAVNKFIQLPESMLRSIICNDKRGFIS